MWWWRGEKTMPKNLRTEPLEGGWAVVATLWEACVTDEEHDVLETLLVRSGLAWKCAAAANTLGGACGWVNDFDEATCGSCKAARPKDSGEGGGEKG